MAIISFILIGVIVIVIGQYVMKAGINSLGYIDFSSGIISSYVKILSSPVVILGVFIYCTGVLVWLYILTKTDLSYAYPFLGLTFLFVTLNSFFFLGEEISLIRWIGVLVISFGVFLVSKS